MSPERWQQAEALLDAALDRPPDERDAFLIEACGTDEELLSIVIQWLQATSNSGDFLNGGVLADVGELGNQAIEEAFRESDQLPPGTRIGRYEIVRPLGEGGMGIVYLAERADGQFEQRVALKVVKRGMDTKAILSRFRFERQLLASLAHPNIARMLDGDVTSGGLPYFVMEYVQGEPIDTYCDRHRLGIDERLALFRTVCEAVNYAHRNLVVHRDLKPANVLVTQEGEVKLLDFGIAKLLDTNNDHFSIPVTLEQDRRMTLEYAAPEQVAGKPATTETDVYALGVILYELLAGHRPYRFKTKRLSEIEHTIFEVVPEKPSTRVVRPMADDNRPSLTPEELSVYRSTQPDRLRRKLAGDLDAIVMTALKKEPERRYPSAAELRADLDHYLNGRPVTARDDGRRYRLAKLIRRNKAVVGAATLAVLALVVGLAIALIQWRVALQEADRADRQAARAEQALGVVLRTFEHVDPAESDNGLIVHVADIIQAGLNEIDDLEDTPQDQADIASVFARLSLSMGAFDDYTVADSLLRAALSIRRAEFGDAHDGVAENLHDLGEVAYYRSMPDTAYRYFQQAYRIRATTLGLAHEQTIQSLNRLAEVTFWDGRFEAADSLYALAIQRARTLPPTSVELPRALIGRARVLNLLPGRQPEAINHGNEAIERIESGTGMGKQERALTLYYHAQHLETAGDFEAAERHFREALAINRSLYGTEHLQVANFASGLANLLFLRGNYEEAEQTYLEALQIYGKILPPDLLSWRIYALIGLAKVIYMRGDPDRAASYLEMFLQEHPTLTNHIDANAWAWYGRCLTDLRRFSDAETRLTASYEYLKNQPTTVVIIDYLRETLEGLIQYYEATGEPALAIRSEKELAALMPDTQSRNP